MFLINTVLWYGVWFLNVHASHKALKPTRRSRKLVPGRNNADRKREVRLVVEGWVVWTAFIFAEGLTDRTLYYLLPFYSEIKSVFMVYLILSRTIGTHAIYINLILPTIHRFSHSFELFFSLIYVLAEATISILPFHTLSSLCPSSLDQYRKRAPSEEHLSIAEGKDQAKKVVREIHQMQEMVRPLSRQVTQPGRQTRVVGVRKRRGELTIPSRPLIHKKDQPVEGPVHLETALSSTQAQIPAESLISAPSTPQSEFELKNSTSTLQTSSATCSRPASNQTLSLYPSLLLKSSPQGIPLAPASASSNSWTLSPLGSKHDSSSVILNTLSLLSNNGMSFSPLASPVSIHVPPPSHRELRRTPARKAKLSRADTELSRISPPKSLPFFDSEASPSKRRKLTKVTYSRKPSLKRRNAEGLEDEETREKHSNLPEEDIEEKLKDKPTNELYKGLNEKRKRGGILRTRSETLEPNEVRNEEVNIESSLEGDDLKLYLPSVQSAARPTIQQRPASAAPKEKLARFAPYSRQNISLASEPTTVNAISRRISSATTKVSSQPATSIRDSTASRSKPVQTNVSSSRTSQKSVSSNLPGVSVSSSRPIHKHIHELPSRSSTRSKPIVVGSDASSTSLPLNTPSSSAAVVPTSTRPLNKLKVNTTRPSASKRTTISTTVEAPIKARVRRTNRNV